MSDLEKRNQEIEVMIEDIKKKLQIVNGAAMKPEFYGADKYEEMKELHQMVTAKPSLSVSEMDAIVSELGKMRNK